jgi:hypothetical protein
VYYWVRDLPLGRPRRENGHPGSRAMCRKYRLIREAAYDQGAAEFELLAGDPSFRDFVCLYIAEGYKRNRNRVSVANSDPSVIVLCTRWIREFARNPLTFSVQYHADQELRAVREFWSAHVGASPEAIRLQRKSNSGELGGRQWRSKHGVLTVTADDTTLHARLQGWIDCLQEQWLHSAPADFGA